MWIFEWYDTKMHPWRRIAPYICDKILKLEIKVVTQRASAKLLGGALIASCIVFVIFVRLFVTLVNYIVVCIIFPFNDYCNRCIMFNGNVLNFYLYSRMNEFIHKKIIIKKYK